VPVGAGFAYRRPCFFFGLGFGDAFRLPGMSWAGRQADRNFTANSYADTQSDTHTDGR